MKHQNVTEAFGILIVELETALKNTRQAAASATQEGSYDEAQARLNEARQIEKFIMEIRAKQREWTALGGKPLASELQRARGCRAGSEHRKRHTNCLSCALWSRWGQGMMTEVLERVYQEMEPHLRPADLEPLPSDPQTPRWRNTAQWERVSMVAEGLLRNDSPQGIWAITEKGRKYLADHSG